MAQLSESDDPNHVVSSPYSTHEATFTKRRPLTISTETLTSPSLPTLPFDVLAEILCMLPVKLLLQLRCLCKSLNSIISDPKFAKKHLRLSTPHHNLIVSSTNYLNQLLLFVSPIPSVFSTSTVMQRQLTYPKILTQEYGAPLDVCSCDGILCLTLDDRHRHALLWNPSIGKYNKLPRLETTHKRNSFSLYSFGYDPFVDDYKVFVVSFSDGCNYNEVNVHVMGTMSWKRVDNFPYCSSIRRSGVFVGGTINWLAYDKMSYWRAIVSFDLKDELYQTLSQPDLENDLWTLGVAKDCLCIFASSQMCLDVWIMKEYGKESWIKLCSVPYIENRGLYAYTKALYISEDDRVLMDFHELRSVNLKLVVYDSKNDTLKIPDIQAINHWMDPEVYVESLISPCS
ncbi:F-box/kelch-repeat protein At3g23880-like [Vicia villosa]|uniref:F-box/kelch-repeat protein At3g23880-like n=1 Tax=Vicia villosa TaxID=3911 RepID=UPI00273CC4BA|nr:F-box/kelch-repeat protein At3g23880-like [Vicia villosa]